MKLTGFQFPDVLVCDCREHGETQQEAGSAARRFIGHTMLLQEHVAESQSGLKHEESGGRCVTAGQASVTSSH